MKRKYMKTHKIFIALIIGFIAGTIDTVPMILQGLNIYACLSAFVHWLVLGMLIPYVSWNIKPWLKGLLIAEITTLPVMIIVAETDILSIIPMTLFSAVLGILVGIAGNKFVSNKLFL